MMCTNQSVREIERQKKREIQYGNGIKNELNIGLSASNSHIFRRTLKINDDARM